MDKTMEELYKQGIRDIPDEELNLPHAGKVRYGTYILRECQFVPQNSVIPESEKIEYSIEGDVSC